MDIKLHFTQHGEGDILIMLHGNGENSDYFINQFGAFAGHFHVIALDTRGHGQSSRGAAPFTLSQFADDLKDFMKEQGIIQAHILGFSDGGNIALLFALRYPHMVKKLILNGANIDPRGIRPRYQIPIIMGYAMVCLLSLFNKKAIYKKELLALMVTQPHIKLNELSLLHMPVLVIAGTEDMVKNAHTHSIAAAIPHAQLNIIPGDHFVAASNSEQFNTAVLAFLNNTNLLT